MRQSVIQHARAQIFVGVCVGELTGHGGGVTAVHVDAPWLLSGAADGNVRMWDLTDNTLVCTLDGTPEDGIVSVRSHFASSPELVVAASSECCRVWNWEKGICLQMIPCADVC